MLLAGGNFFVVVEANGVDAVEPIRLVGVVGVVGGVAGEVGGVLVGREKLFFCFSRIL